MYVNKHNKVPASIVGSHSRMNIISNLWSYLSGIMELMNEGVMLEYAVEQYNKIYADNEESIKELFKYCEFNDRRYTYHVSDLIYRSGSVDVPSHRFSIRLKALYYNQDIAMYRIDPISNTIVANMLFVHRNRNRTTASRSLI